MSTTDVVAVGDVMARQIVVLTDFAVYTSDLLPDYFLFHRLQAHLNGLTNFRQSAIVLVR
jgi:hypothetical protein